MFAGCLFSSSFPGFCEVAFLVVLLSAALFMCCVDFVWGFVEVGLGGCSLLGVDL